MDNNTKFFHCISPETSTCIYCKITVHELRERGDSGYYEHTLAPAVLRGYKPCATNLNNLKAQTDILRQVYG